jgi:NAD(P)-dependent dehydrogenase (short-subunit alcohol dehydrogenase family)
VQGNDLVCPDVEREEIPEAVLYVASDESRWTTGSNLTVGGGVMAA